MIKLIRGGVYYMEGSLVKESVAFMVDKKKQAAVQGTISYGILKSRNTGSEEILKLKFDNLLADGLSGDRVVELASALGIDEFKSPFTFIGGEIKTAEKFGFDAVPSLIAKPQQYVCETTANSGGMILSTESTGSGALGAMTVTEDSSVLVKQLLGKTYEAVRPQVFAVYLKGKPKKGVGAYDVALELIGATYKKGFLKDCILEFIGPGVKNISVDYRMELDALAGKTGCLASVWETDKSVKEYFESHNRAEGFKQLSPSEPAYYDGGVIIDLSRVEPMIAVNGYSDVYTIREFTEKANEITEGRFENGKVIFTSGSIDASGLESISEVCEILKTGNMGAAFSLNVSPQSLPAMKSLTDNGCLSALLSAGAEVDLYGNSNVVEGVCIMDARSIAATAANGGALTPATKCEYVKKYKKFNYDGGIYNKKVYRGYGKPNKDIKLDIEASCAFFALPESVRFKVISDNTEELELSDNDVLAHAVETAYAEDICALKEDGFSAVITAKYNSLRYRKNLVNWGILPFVCRKFDFNSGDEIYIENITELVKSDCTAIPAKHISNGKTKNIMLDLPALTDEEKKILLAGGLANLNN